MTLNVFFCCIHLRSTVTVDLSEHEKNCECIKATVHSRNSSTFHFQVLKTIVTLKKAHLQSLQVLLQRDYRS